MAYCSKRRKTNKDRPSLCKGSQPAKLAGGRGNSLQVCSLAVTSAQGSWEIFIVEWGPGRLFLEGTCSVNLCVVT